MTTVLEFRDIEKTYPGEPPVQAVDKVSLKLERGAFAALIGPSGSGKTSLLNLASGLDRPTRGDILISGQSIVKLSQKELCLFRRKHLGFVFQSYNLFPVLSAVENVEYTSVMRGDNRKEARKRATESLETVGLGDKLARLPSQLSGGQQQRVAVARALATQPDIVFADEPTANLDSKTAYQLIELFERLNRELKVTFLFSTHDSKLVDRVSRKLEMKDGQFV